MTHGAGLNANAPPRDVAPEDVASEQPPLTLARGALHEFYARGEADSPSLSALALILGRQSGPGKPMLWVRHEALARQAGEPHPSGLTELGLDPAELILFRAPDPLAALQAGLEGARCAALGAVILEMWGDTRAYDLTASRRLALAAKASRVLVLLARVAATALPSAAESRWQVAGAPSESVAFGGSHDARAGPAPGLLLGPLLGPQAPCFEITLLRARQAEAGLRYHLRWNRDVRRLDVRSLSGTDSLPEDQHAHAPLSGAVVSLPFGQPRPSRPLPLPPARRAG